MENTDELVTLANQLIDVIDAARRENPPPSGILHFSTPDPASRIAADGSDAQTTTSQHGWEQIYTELYRGASSEAASLLPSPDELDERVRSYARQKLVPIVVGHFTYHSVATLFENLMKTPLASGQTFTVPTRDQLRDACEERTAFFASARLNDVFREYTLLPHVHRGLAVNFVLPADSCLGNAGAVENVEIDFGDGRGARPITLDQVEHVEYQDAGAKRLVLTARAGGKQLRAQFEFEVEEARRLPEPIVWTDLTRQMHFGDKTTNAVGHAWVVLGTGHSTLQQPIIICDGFPGHEVQDFSYVWDLLNAEGFADSLLQAGRDLIIVSYQDGTTYVEANAGVLIAAIIRAIKERTTDRRLIVGGASMGGLVARYALAYMEKKKMPELSKVDIYFSFDTPHLGANLPLSVQFLLYAFRDRCEIEDVRKKALSIASQEMLLYWVNEKGVLPSENCERQRFVKRLGDFDHTTKKIAIANGDGRGFENYTPASEEVLSWVYETPFGRYALIDLFSAQGVQFPKVDFRVYFDGGSFLFHGENKMGTTLDLPRIDSAPGGTNSFFGEIGKQLKKKYPSDPLTVAYKSSCFIPTISALAMPLDPTKEADLVRDLTAPPHLKTPFDIYKFSEINTPHVTITPEIKRWLLENLGIDSPKGRLITEITGTSNEINGATELFAIGNDGQVLHRYYNCLSPDNCHWSNWDTTTDGSQAPPSLKVLSASDPLDRREHAFLISKEMQLWHNSFDGRWAGWSRGVAKLSFPGLVDSMMAVPNVKGNCFQLFVISETDWFVNSLQNGRWSGWHEPEERFYCVFPVVNPRNHNIELFGIVPGPNGSGTFLIHGYYDGTTFVQLTHNAPLGFKNALSVSAATNTRNNNLEVFLVTTDHQLFHNYYSGGDNGWHSWSDSRAGLKFPSKTVADVVAIENNVQKGIIVFVRTTDGLLYVNYFSDNEWHGWSPERAGLELPTRVNKVFALRNNTQPNAPRIEAFAISTSQALYHNSFRYDANSDSYVWDGWNYWAVPVEGEAAPSMTSVAR